MKRMIGLIAGSMMLAGIGAAKAQDVIFVPEQEVVIREYVVAHPVEPIPVIDGVEVGQVLPPEVAIYPIDSPDMAYSYVDMDNQTLIVDSETREIMRILD